MRHLTVKNIPLAFLGISVLIIGLRFFAILSFPDTRTLGKGDIVNIFPGQTFSQKFTAGRDNLESIQILLRTPGIKDGDILTAQLTDETCTETLAEGTFKKPFINTDDMYIFRFPRISTSNGETFCLFLSYRTSGASSKYLRLFTTPPTDTTTPLLNVATKEPLNGASLSLRTVYRNDHFWQDLAELNRRISQYKPWFLKNGFIASIATLFVGLSIALALILIHTKSGQETPGIPLQKKRKP